MRPPVYLSESEELPPMVGGQEAADLLGVTTQRVRQLALADNDFPPPAINLLGGRVWYRADIEAWAEANAERRELRRRKTA